MPRIYLLLIAILFVFDSSAQNYQCINPGKQRFFVNENGYLKGIRIDSVKTTGTATFLYPFHTPRGYWATQKLDSNGGSWLGKTIIMLPEGTHFFDTYWGDTVVLKTQAGLNDTWIFYDDATTDYYIAKITDIDTMSVLPGIIDSVKEVTLTSMNAGGINQADSLNNAKIIFSKNYGFIQIFDLYFFPMHSPGNAYSDSLDFFLRTILKYQNTLNKRLYFTLINFPNPHTEDIYNFDVGDVFEARDIWYLNGMKMQSVILYQITGKQNIPSKGIQYKRQGWGYTEGPYIPGGHQTQPFTDSVLYTSGFFISDKMPEEWGQQHFIYYSPDNNLCNINSSLFERLTTEIGADGSIVTFEPCYTYEQIKEGFGLLFKDKCSDNSDIGEEYKLVYSKINGVSCGTYISLDIPENKAINNIEVSPNPAHDNLLIKHTSNIESISLVNALGQTLGSFTPRQKSITINVSYLPAGIYTLSVINNEGIRIYKKIQISH